MSYPFVQSAADLAAAKGPRLAVVWHFAEGGGTVGFLSRPNRHGVSVHYVIEYSGRIVQMLSEARMHTSLRTSNIRTTNDTPYSWRGTPVRYGASAARAAMGDWASTGKTLGPNHASISVEVEGFARDGPNGSQEGAMARLWADVKSRHPKVRSLGHRDFASYKACPGKLLPWEEVGGHASSEEATVRNFALLYDGDGRLVTASLTFPDEAASVLILATDKLRRVNTAWVKQGVRARLKDPIIAGKPMTDDWTLGWVIGDDAAFALDRNVIATPYVTSQTYTVVTMIGSKRVTGAITLP